MTDESYVSLYILLTQAKQAKTLFHKEADYENLEAEGFNKHLAFFGFDRIKEGDLPFLDKLQEAGIAYDSCWCAGDNGQYTAGTHHVRFDAEGAVIFKEIFEDEENSIDLGPLLELLDDHEALKKCILDRQEQLSILPWDYQEENGKLYLATQLITR